MPVSAVLKQTLLEIFQFARVPWGGNQSSAKTSYIPGQWIYKRKKFPSFSFHWTTYWGCCTAFHTSQFPTHFRNVISGEELGRSKTTVAVWSLAWSVYCMAIVRRAENHCCQALLVLWSGSALAKFTYLPKGANRKAPFITLLSPGC